MSCIGNSSNINETFIIEPLSITGGSPTLSACTGLFTNEVISCDGNAEIFLGTDSTIFNTDIMPTADGNIAIGSTSQRFRDINTISGRSSVWVSTISVATPILDLGLDSNNNSRIITADNSVIQDDTLFGGIY